jgi:DNA-binding IclR family transcriptional regulator
VSAAPRQTTQAVDRAIELLKAVADSREPPTVLELSEACGLNRSTAWRLLGTLDRHGLVERDPVTQRYGLGPALLRIAASGEHDAIVRRAHPVLKRLAEEAGEAVNLALARRVALVYVDQVDPPQVMAPNWLGREVPLHATSSGKAFLAWLPPEERAALLPSRLERYTATTICDRRRLDEELAAVHEAGHAISIGELEDGLNGASAPVLSEKERPLGVVSVWGPAHRLPAESLPATARRVRVAADQIRELLR